MLTHLSIQGLAIIENLSIDFTTGFNVITGETGAGKSILIKALSLLLGGKANSDSVRRGFDQATVSGKFSIKQDHPALKILECLSVVPAKNGDYFTISVRRVVTSKSRSSAWINDHPVTTGALKELASNLIDVFGQHDSHRLLDSQHHTSCLDQFVEPRSLLRQLHDSYTKASKTIHQLRVFVDEATGKERNIDYLTFRLTELEEFKPEIDDYNSVKILSEMARQGAAMAASLQHAQNLFDGSNGDSISKRLREMAKALSQSKSSELEAYATETSRLARELDDLSFSLERASKKIDVSENDVDLAESRIAGYQSLLRKHNVNSISALCEAWDALRRQVAALENAADHVGTILASLVHEVKDVMEVSTKISTLRKRASSIVVSRVEKELADLAMPSAKFSVDFSPVSKSIPSIDLSGFGQEIVAQWSEVLDDWTSVSESGIETAEFYLAANKGESSLPLSRVASGGEVSRIMLALKKALVVGAETCVLVFDEIDTGISGRIADIVGQKIAELAGYCQIICISHLPQVAAYANRHYIVRKTEVGGRTESIIEPLSKTQRLDEMARLLSGDKVTKASLEHAKSLVNAAAQRCDVSRSKNKPLNEV